MLVLKQNIIFLFFLHSDLFVILTVKSCVLMVDLFPQQDMDDGAPPSKKGKLDSSSEAN